MQPSDNKQKELARNATTSTIANEETKIELLDTGMKTVKNVTQTTTVTKNNYNGSWCLSENRGHEQYLKAVGENFFIRKLFNSIYITCEISHTDTEYSVVTRISPKFTSPDVMKGKFGEEIEVKNPRGEREVRRLEWVDGSVVAHSTLKDRGNQKEKRHWKLIENSTVMEMTIDNLTHSVSYTQFYKKTNNV